MRDSILDGGVRRKIRVTTQIADIGMLLLNVAGGLEQTPHDSLAPDRVLDHRHEVE